MRAPEKLKHLFNQPYKRDAWLGILDEQLPLDRFSQPIAIQGEVQTFYQLGKTILADGEELGVYEIKTNPQTQLHRNRVQMRQLVAKQCQESALDGALAVYYDDRRHWRFSFISMEYKLDEQGQVKKEESAPKRYTYLLGKDAKIRTAVERFSRLNKTATLDDLKMAFAVGQLNKEFYKELFKWYERAKLQVVFPNDEQEEEDKHVSISLIRLLTRLLFVWFLREKGLVNRNFFEFDKVSQIIDWKKENGYYKAILQNLFFATLNREIDDRTFRTTTNGKPNSNNYLVPNVYRYQNVFLQQRKNAIVRLFEPTPFLNGGLFECLDRDANEDEQQAYEKNRTIRKEKFAIRLDGFSDRNDNGLRVPNDLFFNEDEKKLGLITLLNRYQFTVEESTPLDADVALDPELLGLVFENLLASYNPETQQTARKASGSYYTPREIVNYMVDESLKAFFAQATDVADDKISRLFQTGDAEIDLTGNETTALIQAIDNIKIIDPAVGTGAFPMGILQRLVHILGIIDPENKQWKQRQVDIIEKLPDIESREQALKEVETIFSEENRFNDFGRKLFLIKKCIYGVDIQPIACQIAKLRFFISLAIEQEPTDNAADNYGIKPLPNLETKFVAADTLRGLAQPAQRPLAQANAVTRPTRKKSLKLLPTQLALVQTDAVTQLEKDLNANRERHFRATTRQTKEKCRRKDKELRNKLAKELKQAGFPAVAVDKIACWDPYDQNACADWFDPEYMFGVANDFDIVIGNPPYIQLQKEGGKLSKLYKDAGYVTFDSMGDIYQLFYEKGVNLLNQGTGHTCFISSNQWMRVKSGQVLRKFIESQNPIRLVNLGAGVFDNVTVNTGILLVNRSSNQNMLQSADLRQPTQQFPPAEWMHILPAKGETWVVLDNTGQCLKDKMETTGTPLKEWDVSINYGIKTGCNDAFIIDDATRQMLIAEDPKSDETVKPVLRGEDIQRYRTKWCDSWLIYIPWHFPLHLDSAIKGGNLQAENLFKKQYPTIYQHLLSHKSALSSRNKSETGIRYEWYALQRWGAKYYNDFAKEKIVWGNLCNQAKFSYAPKDMLVTAPSTFLTPFSHYLLAVLNSKLLDWYFRLIGVERDGGYYEYKPMFIERLPIPKISPTKQRPFIKLVDSILTAKASHPKTDTTKQEAELDQLVYGLYGLTTEEIAVVENQ